MANLEKRLAAARIQRQKVMEARGKTDEKPSFAPPPFFEKNENGTLVYDEGAKLAPDGIFDGDGFKLDPGRRFAELSEPAASAATKEPKPKRQFSVLAVGFIAFACFFGLGSGVILSLSAAIGMGWLQFASPAEPGAAENAVRSVSVAPSVQSNSGVVLEPIEKGVADAGFDVAALRPAAVLALVSTNLPSPAQPDILPPAIKFPSRDFDFAAQTDELVLRNDFQPLALLTATTLPVRPPVLPAALSREQNGRDSLPNLPEKSNVAYVLTIEEPRMLGTDFKNPVHLSLTDNSPQIAPTPVLYASAPGVVPAVLSAAPQKLAIFEEILAEWSAIVPGTLSPVVYLPVFAGIKSAPTPSAFPSPTQAAYRLPAVGDTHRRKLNLAEELAYQGAAVNDVRLVTYAPRSIADRVMTGHLQFLNETGFGPDRVNRVNYRVSRTHLRFYNQSDAVTARVLAAKMGVEARDFTSMNNPPPEGRIEIYLQGTPVRNARPAAAAPQVSRVQRQSKQKTRLERSIVSKLRSGAHLSSAGQ